MTDEYRSADERGATSSEYALMAGMIALVIVGAVTTFGAAVAGLFGLVPPGL